VKIKCPGLWLALAVSVGIFAPAMLLSHDSQPSYGGYTLSEWLDEYYVVSRDDINNDSPKTEAYYALRAIGTNALPTLLRWVAHEPTEPSQQLQRLVRKLPNPIYQSRFIQDFLMRDRRPNFWHQGFLILGPQANGAVPELTRLMRSSKAQDDGFSAALALAYIGPAGLAPLEAAAADTHARCRISAISALGDMGANALPAVPLLIQSLDSTNPEVSGMAASALQCLQIRDALPLETMPSLVPALHSPDALTRVRIAEMLAKFSPERPAALQVLHDALNDPDESARSEATNAFEQIPPL
jgi:hypothetical protein